MYICVCNAIREAELSEAARALPGDAEALYAEMGKVPQCCQCLEEADELVAEARHGASRLKLVAA